jgi:hypothetical protein
VKWLIGVALILVILLTPLWLLRITDSGNWMVQNGLQQFVVCGKARAARGDDPMSGPLAARVMEASGGARVGTWSVDRRAGCDTFRHFPRDLD